MFSIYKNNLLTLLISLLIMMYWSSCLRSMPPVNSFVRILLGMLRSMCWISVGIMRRGMRKFRRFWSIGSWYGGYWRMMMGMWGGRRNWEGDWICLRAILWSIGNKYFWKFKPVIKVFITILFRLGIAIRLWWKKYGRVCSQSDLHFLIFTSSTIFHIH